MGATSLAFKVYLILGFELVVLYGCTFFIIQQCKKAFYANKTFLGIALAEAVNPNRQTDICIVKNEATTLLFFGSCCSASSQFGQPQLSSFFQARGSNFFL
jgi:hypothetical protein